MLKVDRNSKKLARLEEPSLSEVQILERADLQEYIFNSSEDFFAEMGESIFVVGKEISPSETVSDRIDILGIDKEGSSVVVELKRGSSKLQMLQAVSYAGMVARWSSDKCLSLISNEKQEQLSEFLESEVEEINRRQRLLLIAEGFDYALLSGAEWLSEQYGVDIRCFSVSLATDPDTNTEYLACTGIYPPPPLADQAAARPVSRRGSSPLRWNSWQEALSEVENDSIKKFAQNELEEERENYLRRRGFHFRLDGKRRWSFYCRKKHAYVWQRGRYDGDEEFWKNLLSDSNSVKSVKNGKALAFNLKTEKDLESFKKVVLEGPEEWLDIDSNEMLVDDEDID